MIENLQKSAQESVVRMNISQRKAEDSVAIALSTGEAFGGIKKLIDQVGSMNTQIASATEQQLMIMLSMEENMVDMRKVYDKTLHAVSATVKSEQQSSNILQQLNQLLQCLKV